MSELDDARGEQRVAAQALYRLYKDKNSKNLRPMLRERLNPRGEARADRPIRDLPLRSRIAYAIGRIVALGRPGRDVRIEQQQAMLQQQALTQSQAALNQMGLQPQAPAPPQGPAPEAPPGQDNGQGQGMPGPGPAQYDPLAQINQQMQALQQQIDAITNRMSTVNGVAAEHGAAKAKGDVFAGLADLGAAVRKERDRSIDVGDVPVAGEFIIAARRYNTELTMLHQEALRQRGIDPENSPDAEAIFGVDAPPVEELVDRNGRPPNRSFGRRTADAERVLLAASIQDPAVHDAAMQLHPALTLSPQGRVAFAALDQLRDQGSPVTGASLYAVQQDLARSGGIPSDEVYGAAEYDRIAALAPDTTATRAAAGQIARDYQSALWDSHSQAQDELLARSDLPGREPDQATGPMGTVDKFAEQQRMAKSYLALQERVGEQLQTGQDAIRDAVNHSTGNGQGRRRKSAAAVAGEALTAPASAPDTPAATSEVSEPVVAGGPRRASAPKR